MEFKIGTIVDVQGRDDLRAYGKITVIKNGRATVHFQQPRTEKERHICDSCGWPGLLSINGGTGEIECMRSGCGHGHGFRESEEIIPIAQLINISAKRATEKRGGFLKELEEVLRRGIVENNITGRECARVLSVFRT